MDQKLKKYMQERFDFQGMKKAGVFAGLKFNDYEGQAKVICRQFSLESIYDYDKIGQGQRVHLSWDNDPNGFRPFITTIGGLKSTDEAKVVKMENKK